MKKIFVLFLFLIAYVAVDTGKKYTNSSKLSIELSSFSAKDLEDEITKNLSKLLQIKTIRGNEIEACLFLQQILSKEGIPSRIIAKEGFPNRANLIAELKGTDPSKEGIILMNHLDVVEADESEWEFPPFSGKITDGKIYGRGAIDMKGMVMMELYAFIAIKKSGIPLQRNLMFLALADEESKSEFGAKFLLKEHADLFKGYKFSLNEGGLGTKNVAFENTKIFNFQYAEKGVLWIKITSQGNSGHGSSPPPTYASKELIEFIQEILQMEKGMTITSETEMFFTSLAKVASFPTSIFLERIQNPIVNRILSDKIQSNRHLNAMTSNTRSLTGLEIPNSGPNVISNQATATIDIRLLPSIDPNDYLQKIESMAKNRNIQVEAFLKTKGNASNVDSLFYSTMYSVIQKIVPDSTVAPFLSPGGTDSRYFREAGFESYGIIPGLFISKELDGFHGKDEYITIENLVLGTKIIYETIYAMNQAK
jgi:acetylornithine deacetylase/succinyl-diaminopimelate desuccinylase-like protein